MKARANSLATFVLKNPDPFPPLAQVSPRSQVRLARLRPRIFVVHGRDSGLKHEVARFLEKLGLEPIILHERPNAVAYVKYESNGAWKNEVARELNNAQIDVDAKALLR